jgi:hypothetical protein
MIAPVVACYAGRRRGFYPEQLSVAGVATPVLLGGGGL